MIMTDGRTDGEWTDGMQMQMDRNFVEILVMVHRATYLLITSQGIERER